MPKDPLDNPEIQARIEDEVYRIQSAWQDAISWRSGRSVFLLPPKRKPWNFEDELVAMLLAKLDAHARNYLGALGSPSLVQEFNNRLRQVGEALIREAEQRGWIPNPFGEDELR